MPPLQSMKQHQMPRIVSRSSLTHNQRTYLFMFHRSFKREASSSTMSLIWSTNCDFYHQVTRSLRRSPTWTRAHAVKLNNILQLFYSRQSSHVEPSYCFEIQMWRRDIFDKIFRKASSHSRGIGSGELLIVRGGISKIQLPR